MPRLRVRSTCRHTYRPIALSALLLLGCGWLARPSAAAEPNETFAEATILGPGVLTTGPQSFEDGGLGITYPNTTIGFFTDGTFTNLIDFDDDGGGIVGDGFGSGLFEYDVQPDGSVPIAVGGFIDLNNDTAFDDFDFDGLSDVDNATPHEQLGAVDLIVRIWEIGNPFVEFDRREIAFSFDAPGDIFQTVLQDNSWIGHQFSAFADNTVVGGNDIDFWRFVDLPPGATFEAETSSPWLAQDTILGWFDDATGDLIEFNDDIDPFIGDTMSRLTGIVPSGGEMVFAVTSYDDFEFIGAHGGSGPYTLSVTLSDIPQPGDFDADGDVDGDDFLRWQASFGNDSGGDADFDGDTDGDDFLIWQSNFGSANGAAGSAAVPEPAGILLCLVMSLRCRDSVANLSLFHRPSPPSSAASDRMSPSPVFGAPQFIPLPRLSVHVPLPRLRRPTSACPPPPSSGEGLGVGVCERTGTETQPLPSVGHARHTIAPPVAFVRLLDGDAHELLEYSYNGSAVGPAPRRLPPRPSRCTAGVTQW